MVWTSKLALLIVSIANFIHGAKMKKANFQTVAIHVGSEPDSRTGAVNVPISLATTFSQKGLGSLSGVDDANSLGKGYEYSRTGNPTRGAFERALAAVEHATHGIAFSSGLAATSSILQTLQHGDHAVCIDDVYGGTQRLFRRIATANMNMSFTFIDMSDPESIKKAITSKTKLVWVESPTNPTLKISDIAAIAKVVKSFGRDDLWLVVDNTFMSPYLQNPLNLGADIVLHSVTKYIGGHSDVVMGAIATSSDDIYTKLKFIQNAVGSVPSPFDCYMALRGLKTLHVRMDAAQKNALAIAQYLEAHPNVERVLYPGLSSHPNHEIATRQASGYGAMVTFFVRGGITEAGKFLSALELFTLAESLGAVESLAESPAVMTHASVPAENRKELGITDNLVRLSVGIEHIDDLLADLKTALEKCAA